jgi:hypothetical protein
MKLILLAVIASALAGTVAYAEEGRLVMGAGNDSCGKWIEARNGTVSHYQYKQWAFGYLSGANWNSGKKQSSPPDGDAAIAFIDQYCRNNPLHSLVLAAAALVQETGGPKATHKWKQ